MHSGKLAVEELGKSCPYPAYQIDLGVGVEIDLSMVKYVIILRSCY